MATENLTVKLIPPIAGFFGALIMLSYMQELPTRHWVSALLFGVITAYFAPPIVLAWLIHNGANWLPLDGSTAGLLGLLLGMTSIHIIGGITVLGHKFSVDPLFFFKRK